MDGMRAACPASKVRDVCLRTKGPFQRILLRGKHAERDKAYQMCRSQVQMWQTLRMGGSRSVARLVLCTNSLTWNYRDSFQSSENPECSQRWDIAQVHKLCHISVIGSSHTNTITHKKSWRYKGLPPYTVFFLPGITEIVFKALKTLKVRRAETLPRFTNSVKYL